MDIACPNCAATYRVPDTLINGVNALRCAACGHTWVPEPPRPAPVEAEAPPPAPEPPPPPDPAPDPQPPAVEPPPPAALSETATLEPTQAGPPDLARRRLPEGPPRRHRQSRALTAAWGVSIALVVIFVLGLVLFHGRISEAWPPFARLAG